MYVYLVFILGLMAVLGFMFLMSTAIQRIQTTFNPQLTNSSWIDAAHFNVFVLAAGLVTNIWFYFAVFIIFGLAYWGWVYTQRHGG